MNLIPILDGLFDSEMTCLTVSQSIYAFITEQRLTATQRAILSSAISLKSLAARLGYSHVNHFGVVFKKRFGYAPEV